MKKVHMSQKHIDAIYTGWPLDTGKYVYWYHMGLDKVFRQNSRLYEAGLRDEIEEVVLV